MNRKKATALIDESSFSTSLDSLQRRKSVRFPPDPLDYAVLDWSDSKDKQFQPGTVGLLVNESYSGCAVIIVSESKPQDGAKLRIKVGAIGPLGAEIVWIKNLDDTIYKLGIHFIE